MNPGAPGRNPLWLPTFLVTLLVGITTVAVLVDRLTSAPGIIAGPFTVAILGALYIPIGVSALHGGLANRRSAQWLRGLFWGSLALALVSVFLGVRNAATDEAYTTPLYGVMMVHGTNPYDHLLDLTYLQYGQTLHSVTYDVYLPLISFLQVPGSDTPIPWTGAVGYKLVCVAAWAGTARLLAPNVAAQLAWANPLISLEAANGFNDLVAVFFVVLALRVAASRWGPVTEFVALGLKQFANVVLVGVHLFQRDYRRTALAVGFTAAWVVPIVLLSGPGVVCRVVLLGAPGVCRASSTDNLVPHENYFLWPVLLAGMFYPQILGWVRRRLRGDPGAPARPPSPGP